MNVVLESQPNCIVTLQVELPPERVEKEWQAVAKNFQRQARIPGYRPGKAPQSLVDSRYAKDIREEATNKLLRESIDEAVKENKLRVITVSNVDDIDIGQDKAMRFKATVVTAPEFDLPDYSSITADVEKPEVNEERVDEWINQLREPHAAYDPVEGRGIEYGDYAVVTYTADVDGKPIAESFPKIPPQLKGRSNAWLLIDESSLAPGFCAAILGAAVGETRSFSLEFPADFTVKDLQGVKVDYTLNVHAINNKVLPELDDALAAKIDPESATVGQLRTKISERLAQLAENQFRGAKRKAALDHLLSQVNCELPAPVVEREMNTILREIVRENQARGVSDDEIKSHQDELIGSAQQSAADRVRGNFLLLRVAEKENLTVGEADLTRAVVEMAARYEIPVQKLVKDLQRRDGIGPLREQILISKALDLVSANVTVRESSAAQPAEVTA